MRKTNVEKLMNVRMAFAALSVLALATTSSGRAQAQVLYRLTGPGGSTASGGVVTDGKALFGTTSFGGNGGGVVYELAPPASGTGQWAETVLHAFPSSSTDGYYPHDNLLIGRDGTLYGATSNGGPQCSLSTTCGTIFSLTRNSGGAWAETIIHAFDQTDGLAPNGSLIMDQSGDLFGTTYEGGSQDAGTVFEMTPPAENGGPWSYQILFSFGAPGTGGAPEAGPVMDANGDLFGTANHGGACDCGLIWELSPPSVVGGAWTETVLHQFDNKGVLADNGYHPEKGLTLGPDGSLFGTTPYATAIAGCAYSSCGTGVVFQLSPPTAVGDPWGYNVLHSFTLSPDGGMPNTTLALDSLGNLYGTTQIGGTLLGCARGCGTAFKLSPPSSPGEPWGESVLSPPSKQVGSRPIGQLLVTPAGELFGTTSAEVFKFPAAEFGAASP